jgi:phage host-nuclease inhibitor protein Gam
MSSEIDARLKAIQSKLQEVVKQCQVLQRENAQLRKQLNRSTEHVSEKGAQLQALQQQVDVLKLGVSGWNETEKAELEKRIDVYLKEIDKCLALLNN